MEAKRLMTYNEFLQMPANFVTDIAKAIDIKLKYKMEFTEQEIKIKDHLLQYYEEAKLGSLRNHFEKCWDK
jgi:hypothetical protein